MSFLSDVADAFGSLVAEHWGGPTAAPEADLAAMWDAAAAQSWCDLDEDDALPVLVTLARVLGGHACPLPLAETYVSTLLFDTEPEVTKQIRGGVIRPLVVTGEADSKSLEAATAATHLLHRDAAGNARLSLIDAVEVRTGLAVPAWSRAQPGGVVGEVAVSDDAWLEAVTILRVFLAARSLAAAARSHELAAEYAKVRTQFGRAIGSFGAVQQRIATAHIDVSAATALIDEAATQWTAGSGNRLFSATLAVGQATTTVPKVQLAAQHTFGAVGYFEDHEAPWLFRRAHADLARLGELPGPGVADLLIDGGLPLPDVDSDDETRHFRYRLRDFIDETGTHRAVQPFVDDPEVVAAFAQEGYLGLTWPKEYGGAAAPAALQSVLIEEVGYGQVGANIALNGVMFLGDALITHGTPEQRERFLPMLRRGTLRYCLGYSEPDNGSDLAGLRLRAERDGDEWVVTGQKAWTTRAQASDWIWLAARTNPDVSLRHRGITVFLVPLDLPGITIHEHRSLAGEVSCSVFFDGVRVPDSTRVGGTDEGWTVINTALAGERTALAGVVGFLHRQLDELVTVLRKEPDKAGPCGSAVRARVATLACGIQGARLLARDAVAAMAAGGGSRIEAPMAAVLSAELAEECGETSLAVLGPSAAVTATNGSATLLHGLLLSVKYVVGGGTNDVLRGLIARSLGLPR